MNFIVPTALVERFWLTDTFGKNPPKIPIRFFFKERAVTIINSTEKMVDFHFVIGFFLVRIELLCQTIKSVTFESG